MTFEEFADYIQQNVLIGWKEDTSASIHKIKKNNGVIYTGVYIRESESMVTPAIYLETYYERYKSGESPDELILDIRREFEWAMSRMSSYEFDISSFACVRDKLIYRLVNYERNKEMLEACPHIRLDDLAMTFRWLAHGDSVGISTALVTNQELALWEVTVQEILLAARKNTERLFPGKIMLLDQFLSGCGENIPADNESVPMFIATNIQQINGAAVILYDHFLEKFSAEHPGDYYILPSSIHEVILIPANRIHDPEELGRIVRHANTTVVSAGEILSDSVYYYDAKKHSISVALSGDC